MVSDVVHRLTEVWQERPGEVSYKCACGMVSKHREFGPVPVCPAIVNPESLTVYTPPRVSSMIRVPIRIEASGYLTLPSGTPMTLAYIREHWADLEVANVISSRQIGSLQTIEEQSEKEPEKQPPTLSSVIRDDAKDRQRDNEIIENMLNYLEDRLYGLEDAERSGKMEKTVVSEATWAGLSAVRSLAQIVQKMRRA